MLLARLVETSREVGSTASKKRKVELLTRLLLAAPPEQIPLVVAYLTGSIPQGRIGIGPAVLKQALQAEPSAEPSLTLTAVDGALLEVAQCRGPGSAGRRLERVAGLMRAATGSEQPFLAQLLLGELRQGALEGVMVEAIARAAGAPAADVRRAVMLAGDTAAVAGVAFETGVEGLRQFRLEVLEPVRPMLAQTAESIVEVLQRFGPVALEHKLDGARVQVHKAGEVVRVFTRRLHDVTASVPDVVEAVRALPAERVILDGEALVLRPDGKPQPFQVTMRRFGRKLDVDKTRAALPLTVAFFDCLHHEGADLIDLPAAERFEQLARAVPTELRVPRLVTEEVDAAQSFIDQTLDAGHEGVMAKALDAPYEAGNRGSGWIKLKPSHTLDLVVLAAEWGHGRRRGWLSNLHLGARDSASGEFLMLGKTFKGMTDDMLRWQTEHLGKLRIHEQDGVVRVRPQLVVEVAFNDVQASPQYPAGMALRFARVKHYRPDKDPIEADGIDAVKAIFEGRTRG